MPRIEGGCLCGAVRYSSDADPVLLANCYCSNCRKNSGSSHSVNIAMPTGSVAITGDTVKTYVDTTGASGHPFNRHFCSNCGTHFRSEGAAYAGIEFIKGGTLDDADWAEPQLHIWCDEKLAWVQLPDGADPIPRNPG